MISAEIHKLVNGKDTVVGKIGAQDGKLVVSPDDPLLHKLASRPIVGEGGEMIDPADADAFVKNLCCEFKSPYLWAEEATEEATEENNDAQG